LTRVKECIAKNHIGVNSSSSKILGVTPLFVASFYGHLDVVQYLVLEAKADLNITNNWNASPLFIAGFANQLGVVEFLLKQPEVDIRKCTGNGRSALFRACIDGHLEVAQLLCECGQLQDLEKRREYINLVDHIGKTPFFVAAWKGRLDVVQYLHEQGADVEKKDHKFAKPVDKAAKLARPFFDYVAYPVDHPSTLRVLQEHSHEYWFLLNENAFFSKRSQAMLALYPELLTVTDHHGQSLLHRAALRGGTNLVSLLNNSIKPMENKEGKHYAELLSYHDRLQLLSNGQFTKAALQAYDFNLWFLLIVQKRPPDRGPGDHLNKLYNELCERVRREVSADTELAYAHDANNHTAMDYASQEIRDIIQSVLLWHGRYHVTELRPEHMSSTCYVFKAVDEKEVDSRGNPVRVALKLMRLKPQVNKQTQTQL
jgi:ankyrin repeat protein